MEFIIAECVIEASTSPFVHRCVQYHLRMISGDKSEVVLELGDIWPWQIISRGHYGPSFPRIVPGFLMFL